jgi:hypothetical protein
MPFGAGVAPTTEIALGQAISSVTGWFGQSCRKVALFPDVRMPTITTDSEFNFSWDWSASQTVTTGIAAGMREARMSAAVCGLNIGGSHNQSLFVCDQHSQVSNISLANVCLPETFLTAFTMPRQPSG